MIESALAVAYGSPAAPREPGRVSGRAEVVAEMFKLLGDATRCRILYALLDSPDLSVSEIASGTGTSRTTVSAALRLLRTAGVVVARRDGRTVHYRVADEHVAELLTIAWQHSGHAGRSRVDDRRNHIVIGHDHGHGASAGDAASGAPNNAAQFRGRLAVTFTLTAAFFVLELVVGLAAGSLAVIADAGHMATDVLALGASLVATRMAGRPDQSGRRTYGRYRAEVFAAGFAVLLMVGVGVFIVVESMTRIGGEPEVSSTPMVVIGLIGLAVNGVGLVLLRTGAKHSINLRGAYLEVLGDAAGSVGVLLAGLLIRWTGSSVWDLVVAVIIGVFVLVRAVGLGRSVLRVLGQHAPEGIDPDAVEADLAAVAGVIEVHDLHLWALTSGMNVATAHLVSAADADHHAVLDAATKVLSSAHHIDHATLQVEPADHTTCREISW